MIRVAGPEDDEATAVYVNPYAVDEIRVRDVPYSRVQVMYRNGEYKLMPQGVTMRELADAVDAALMRLGRGETVGVIYPPERRMSDPQ